MPCIPDVAACGEREARSVGLPGRYVAQLAHLRQSCECCVGWFPAIIAGAEMLETPISDDIEPERSRRVQQAVKRWIADLIDIGGRNNLLNYRERLATLNLARATPDATASLLRGHTIRASRMFAPEDLSDALRRLRAIYGRTKEHHDERGIETLHLACGFATWTNAKATWTPAAPVLLRAAELKPVGAAMDEFEVTLIGDMQPNQSLVHLLSTEFQCHLDENALAERLDGQIDEQSEINAVFDWMSQGAGAVPGWSVAPGFALANFTYAKLPMVRDLSDGFQEIGANDLIAAIAGDEGARQTLRDHEPSPGQILAPDQTPLADEFLILDADATQNYAINAVLAGANLVIKGPPGTGKSQSIANLIATLIARGKKVLFVAEKRAAIDAVVNRLQQHRLDHLVLDAHGGISKKAAFAKDLGRALESSREAEPVSYAEQEREVEAWRTELNRYDEALHVSRDPWDISVYDAHTELLGIAPDVRTDVRFRHGVIHNLDARAEPKMRADVRTFARLGGFSAVVAASRWREAAFETREAAGRAYDLAEDLTLSVQKLASALEPLRRYIPAGASLDDIEQAVSLWSRIERTLQTLDSQVFDDDPDDLCRGMAPAQAGALAQLWASVWSADYRRCRRRARTLVRNGAMSNRALLDEVRQAADELRAWRSFTSEPEPVVPPTKTEVAALCSSVRENITELDRFVIDGTLLAIPLDDLSELLGKLVADRWIVVRMPELHRLRTTLQQAGLAEFMTELALRERDETSAAQLFRYVWLRSIVHDVGVADGIVSAFVPEQQDAVVRQFRSGDRAHIESTSPRLLRIAAERAVAAREAFPTEESLVRHQANLTRKHMPVRDFLASAPNVILALKPCWAMSPLSVSQILPAKALFDVVVFDEASQVLPADAVASILRGRQIVVAGDEHQLPPTAFFVSDDPDPNDPKLIAAGNAGTEGFESILDVMNSFLQFRTLGWHYRSVCEALIAFSNAHIYDRRLTTFPGIGGETCLRSVVVPWEPNDETNSPSAEVRSVVELIIEHVRSNPEESLGVIAMGIKHATRVDEALRQRLRDDPVLAEETAVFFDEDKEERFFVKNLERVQGDERDAIILSIGYGKDRRGQLVYRFGPLSQMDGGRRLNVAITRAKRRLTAVASFSHQDMDPAKITPGTGVDLLRQYLQYVESGGRDFGDVFLEKPELNPFEIDVRDTLTARGLHLVAQYGSSGYRIDFAVQHPEQRGRFVLAIECDGASYHSSQSARDRDRLRQDQLERLGWRFHRIWSSDWFYNREAAAAKAVAAYEIALRDGQSVPPEESAEPIQHWAPTTQARGPRPYVARHSDISEYAQSDLVRLARWVESDGRLRTEEEIVDAMMLQLGFHRHGSRIIAMLTEAIRRARAK